jgi:hypothetical protein
MVFFLVIPVFLQLRWIGLFRTKRGNIHLDTCKFQELFLSKITQFSQAAVCPMLKSLMQMVFFRETHVLHQLCCIHILWPKSAFLHLEIPMLQKYSLLKRNQFSLGNNLLVFAASNIHGFLCSDICVSSTLMNRPICNKKAYPHLEKPNLQEVLLSERISVLTAKQCARCCSF